jgi:hypothetical protein
MRSHCSRRARSEDEAVTGRQCVEEAPRTRESGWFAVEWRQRADAASERRVCAYRRGA